MNDAQLEFAARKLCELHGVKADEPLDCLRPPGMPRFKEVPRWKEMSGLIDDHLKMQEAIQYTLEFGPGEKEQP